MFKRILKVTGICLAAFILIVGAAVGIFTLSGGFKEKVVDITKLYIDDTTKADKEIYTLGDISTSIQCEPLDATDKKLEVIVSDPLRVFDDKGNLIKEGILKNIPKYVNVGEVFNLEVNKDAMGNNIGGVVTLTFRPANKDKIITDFTLKVVVDVAIPNNSLYFAGNDSDELTTSGKSITMGLSSAKQNIYLKSSLVNAFCLETSKGNLKSAQIGYVYRNQKGEVIQTKDKIEGLQYKLHFDPVTKEYNYYYEVPFTPNVPGTIEVTAKMHKTNEIENAYNTGYFGNSFDKLSTLNSNSNEAQLALDAYNAFINKYIAFFDNSEESYRYFRDYLTDDGLVKLPFSQIEASKKFIFQSCTTSITVTAVNLSGITSIESAKEYNVLTSKTLTVNQMINEFGLNVTLDQEDVANINAEKANLFNTLQVRPYVYVEKEEYINNKETLWKDYKTIYGVYNFEDEKPVVGEEPMTEDDIVGFNGMGYLILLERSNATYLDYITINTSSEIDNKYWTIDFNVPLINESILDMENIKKALYLEFEVSGRDLQKNEKIVKNTFARVFIEYTDYSYKNDEDAKIGFPDTIKRMAINHTLQNATGYAEKLNQQNIDIRLKDTINNYDEVQYKSVMYFVEEKSNKTDGNGQKIATVGRYNFKYMNSSDVSDTIKIFGTNETLVGERLLNAGTRENPNYYIHALNASPEPANIFAVVYLSDKDGNPIDINGRKIVVNELNTEHSATLVVFAITDISEVGMAKVYVDSFVENMNYYTVSAISHTFEEVIENPSDEDDIELKYTINPGYVKRNVVSSVSGSVNGEEQEFIEFSEKTVKEIQDLLTLKLLYKKQFEIIATNFELDKDGKPSIDEDGETILKGIKDFNGKVFENGLSYTINTLTNKQLAFNYMCKDFDQNYELNVKAAPDNPVLEALPQLDGDSGNAQYIRFVIQVEEKKASTDDYIYIMPKEGRSPINALAKNDVVNWKVSKVEAQDVVLDPSIETNVKLHSLYVNKDNYPDDTQKFVKLKFDQSSGLSSQDYYLYDFGSNGVGQTSIENNVKFEITSNLGGYEVKNGQQGDFVINLDVVDISQAIYDEEAEYTGEESEDLKNLYFYQQKYLKTANNVTVDYLNPNGLYQLTQDLVFTNQKNSVTDTKYDDYLYIAGEKYEINSDTVYIDNQLVILDQHNVGEDPSYKQLTIKAGTYVPCIKYKDKGFDTIILLGQEFEVLKETTESGGESLYIKSIHEQNSYTKEARVEKLGYNPHDYIYDGTLEQSAADTALKMNKDEDGNVVSASVNFLKGGLDLDIAGPAEYEKDEHGIYCLECKVGQYTECNNKTNHTRYSKVAVYVLDNDNGNYCYDDCVSDQYSLCNNTGHTVRYSKAGAVAFLMIRFEGIAFDKPITKVIRYELVQEPVKLQAYDYSQRKKVYIGEEGTVNPDTSIFAEKFEIAAGQTTTIKLSKGIFDTNTGTNYINIVSSNLEDNFFSHCQFELDGMSSDIKFDVDGNSANYTTLITRGTAGDSIKIVAPHLYRDSTANLKINYPYQGEYKTVVLKLTIKANYSFESKLQLVNDSYYKVELDANSVNELFVNSVFMGNWFEYTGSLSATICDNGQNIATLNGNKLVIGESYGVIGVDQTEPTINRDYFDIELKLNDMKIAYNLRVVINPTYTIDFRGLKDITLLNGQSLLDSANYVKIYEGGTTQTQVNDFNIYKDLLKVTDKDGNVFDPYNTDRVLIDRSEEDFEFNKTTNPIKIVYKYGIGNALSKSQSFGATVKGYEFYYSELGEFKLQENDKDRADLYNRITHQDNIVGGSNKYEFTHAKIYLPNTFYNGNNDVNDFFTVFTTGNTTNLYVMLKDAEGNYVTKITTPGKYYVAVSRSITTDDIVMDTNILVDIVAIDTYFSSIGDIKNKEKDDLTSNKLNNNVTIYAISETINVQDYFKSFEEDSSVAVVLKDSEGNIYDNGTNILVESEKTYDICYQIAGKLYNIGHTATIYKVDAYASEAGDLAGKSKSELAAGNYALENISVTKDHGDVINVQDYYRFFIGDSEIEVNFKYQSNRLSSINVTEDKTYTICCIIDSTVYNLNCTFGVSVVTEE